MARCCAIRISRIEIDEDVTRFRAFAWAYDATLLQLIHDASGARIAETQPTLHERDARLLFAANDFDALLNQIFVFLARALLDVEAADGLRKLPMDFHLVARLALLCDEIDDA